MEATPMIRAASLAAALLATACTSDGAQTASAAPAAGDRDCFAASAVSGFSFVDNHHVRLSVGPSRDYILTTTWNARDLDWTQAIALRSSSNFICTGNGLGVEVVGGPNHQTYPITGIARAPEASPPAPQGS
jgi:hypothetical protein